MENEFKSSGRLLAVKKSHFLISFVIVFVFISSYPPKFLLVLHFKRDKFELTRQNQKKDHKETFLAEQRLIQIIFTKQTFVN